jgi:hypothetical protein
MKVFGLFPRYLFVTLISSCLLMVIFAPPANAQNSFTYPAFPLSSATGLQVNGTATAGTGTLLQLTSAAGDEVGSAWYTNPSSQSEGAAATLALSGGFSTTFTLQFTGQGGETNGGKAGADGIAFVVQNGGFAGYGGDTTSGALAVGPSNGLGGEIGFNGLTNSVAVQFDTWCNSEYADTCASGNSPTSADQVTIESCGTAANTVAHNTSCQFGTVDLSGLATPIYIGDRNAHTVQVQYVPPTVAGTSCPSKSPVGTSGCGTLTVTIDSQTVLTVAFNLGIINGFADSTDSAFVGFTGATGGAYEVQDVTTWNFGVTITQTFNTNTPTTANFTTPGGENEQTLDLSTANGNLTCKDAQGNTITCPTITLLTTNNTLSAATTWPQYVKGTPWATSVCAARPANGGTGDLCSLFVNACFGGTVSQSQADDYFCPSVTPDTNGTITLADTWDPLTPKPTIAPGTTVSLIDFVPSTPGETWIASTPSQTTNPVCTNVSTSFKCDISDTLTVVYGDQTTTRGSKPKKGWIVTVFNVPMIATQWSVLSTGCPTGGINLNNNPASSTTWFNASCQLQYQVNQATASGTSTNNFVAAPPATISYGLNAAITPAATDVTNTNGTLGNPWIVDPGSINTVIGGLDSQNPLPDGTYILHWSAVDNVGISEKSIQLDQTTGDSCNNPVSGGTPATFSAPCYNTNLFTTQINVDSTNPAIKSVLSAPGSPAGTFYQGQPVSVTYTCNDPYSNNVASGIMTCANTGVSTIGVACPTSPQPVVVTLPTTSLGAQAFTETAVDCAGNKATNTINYFVAPNDNLQISTIPLLTLSTGIPGLIPVTFGAAITNLSTATADDVTVTTTFSTLPSGVVLGTPTATISTVTCTNSPCTLRGVTISTIACSASWPTVTCSVPTLGAVSSKTGLWMEIIVPVAKNSKTGKFTSTSVVTSAGVDPTLGNNTVTQTYTIF